MRKNEASPVKPIENKNLSVKILDLKLPMIVTAPKGIIGYINTYNRAHLVHKTNYRSRSIMSELYIAPNGSLLN